MSFQEPIGHVQFGTKHLHWEGSEFLKCMTNILWIRKYFGNCDFYLCDFIYLRKNDCTRNAQVATKSIKMPKED